MADSKPKDLGGSILAKDQILKAIADGYRELLFLQPYLFNTCSFFTAISPLHLMTKLPSVLQGTAVETIKN